MAAAGNSYAAGANRDRYREVPGTIVEVFAQSGFVVSDALSTGGGDREADRLPFSVHHTTYAGTSLAQLQNSLNSQQASTSAAGGSLTYDQLIERSTGKMLNDLTDLFCVGDPVTCNVDMMQPQFGHSQHNAQSSFGTNPAQEQICRPRVVDIVLMCDPTLEKHISERRQFVEEDCGVVLQVNDDGGLIKSERWGNVRFETRSLVLTHEYVQQCNGHVDTARYLIKVGRAVHMRAYAPPPKHDQWVAVSISPDGEEYSGEGVIVQVRPRHAFIGTKAFGHIFLPYEVLKVKREMIQNKEHYWKQLVGYRVKFRMSYSQDGNPHRCPWRALYANLV